MRFTATYTDDSMSFDANGWEDAIEQAVSHEAYEYGVLLDLKRDVGLAQLQREVAQMEPLNNTKKAQS